MVGCSKDEQPEELFEEERQESVNENVTKESQPLKVLTYFEQKEFDRLYGNAFEKKYPGTRLELINLEWDKPIIENVEKNNPDIIITWGGDYQKLVAADMLAEINYGFNDLEQIHPQVISFLEALSGNGKLYGLTDYFTVTGLKYNKQLFDKYRIDYPTDGMTWDELFHLAKRFPSNEEGKEAFYGFYYPSSVISNLITEIRFSAKMSYLDSDGRVNLRTKQWKDMLSLIAEGLQEQYLYHPIADDTKVDLFNNNRAAMTLASITPSELAAQEHIGFVTAPSGFQTKAAVTMSPGTIFAVSNRSKHPECGNLCNLLKARNWPDNMLAKCSACRRE